MSADSLKTFLVDRVLPSVVAIVLALISVTYFNVTGRVAALEQQRDQDAQQTTTQTTQLAVVQRDVAAMKELLATISEQVEAGREQQEILMRRTDALLIVISQNRKDYLVALDRWNAILAATAPPAKPKK